MPLVKGGQIADDAFAHVADDAELPADGAVLVTAKRFLGASGAILQTSLQEAKRRLLDAVTAALTE